MHLPFVEEGRPVMEWTKRVKVAAGAARGIAYLHEDCNSLQTFSMFTSFTSIESQTLH